MLLFHIPLLLRFNCPVYADIEPGLQNAVEGLRVIALSNGSIEIEGLKDGSPIPHGLSMFDDASNIRLIGVNMRLYCNNEDPVSELLDAGMEEHELTNIVMLLLNDTHSFAE